MYSGCHLDPPFSQQHLAAHDQPLPNVYLGRSGWNSSSNISCMTKPDMIGKTGASRLAAAGISVRHCTGMHRSYCTKTIQISGMVRCGQHLRCQAVVLRMEGSGSTRRWFLCINVSLITSAPTDVPGVVGVQS